MGSIATSIGRIGLAQAGHGGVPLLFLHGVGSDKSAWDGQLARLSADRTVLAIDHPGYGESDAISQATGDDFAEAALAVLDALAIARAHVCGLSLGGIIALTMAERAPTRVASLLLADTFAVHPDGAAILARAEAGVAEHGMAGLAEARIDALLAEPADAELRRALVATMSAIGSAAYLAAARIVWLADRRAAAASVNCPTLILCGREDRVTPPALSEDLKRLMPHAGLIEIAGAGHLPNLEQPAIFDRVVRAFLSDVERIS